jgi:MazG family protein
MKPTKNIEDLIQIMRRLRDPNGGCPWDLQQTYDTIKPHTIEEAYEVADAIERKDFDDLKAELGDLLFQPIYYAQLASEEQRFDFGDIVYGISEKLIRRHPHVFGDKNLTEAEDVNATWENIKAEERKAKGAETEARHASVLDDVPRTLPALSRANKLAKRAARVDFDWPTTLQAFEKLQEEVNELESELAAPGQNQAALEEEMGDLLFAMANVARKAGIDPEEALNKANAKFIRRFEYIEQRCREENIDIKEAGLEKLDAFWNEVRAADKA